ncbi:MAG TPA: nicotinate (nicotinamide) nucleotide adenylyltransferase [Gaiellaceae bacterium]|nr:nicotinate (nicotinamide) nucleotide adenylyltransferase [Gaiellaceae bacterium]
MTVGLLGGAFDPPHNGHLALAGAALGQFDLNRLVVIPTGDPPHKHVATDAETRFRLAEAAFAGLPAVEVSRHELDRMGPSYTVDTARWAAKRYGDAIFLVGADEFCDFLSWRGPDEILDAVRLGVASRPGFPQERLDTVLRGLRRPERVEFFVIEPLPIESRELRARVGRDESISALVPPAVARLVEEGGLYRG